LPRLGVGIEGSSYVTQKEEGKFQFFYVIEILKSVLVGFVVV
jgi:hypothetical protein